MTETVEFSQAPTPATIGNSNTEKPATRGSNYITAKPGEGFAKQAVVKGYEEVPVQPEATPEAPPETQAVPKVSTKKLVDIAKSERKLQERAKKVEEDSKRIEAYQQALKSPDLIDALVGLGVSEDTLIQAAIDRAIKDPKPQKSKEEKIQDERDAKLKAYEDRINRLEAERLQEKEEAAALQVKSQYVAPVINNNPDKYEVLIDIFGSPENVIEQVYKELNDEFQRSGQTYSPEEAADAMEAYWADTFEKSLQKAKNLKKFGKYFAQEQQNTTQDTYSPSILPAESFGSALAAKLDNQVALGKTSATKTLTNNMSHDSTSTIQPYTPAGTSSVHEQYLARFMKSKGL